MPPNYTTVVRTIASILALVILALTIALVVKFQDFTTDSIPIETFAQNGHTFEIRHSSECSCKK